MRPNRRVVPVDASGGFNVLIDVSSCIADFFGGSDVTVDVSVAGVTLTGQPITPVVYAKYADRAARTLYVNGPAPTGTVGSGTNEYSVGGGYCGTSATKTNGRIVSGTLVGVRAAKAICETTCGSRTAHMCTPDELWRSLTTGSDYTAWGLSWVSSGGVAISWGGQSPDECTNWTSTVGGGGEAFGNPSAPWMVSPIPCSSSMSILCCD